MSPAEAVDRLRAAKCVYAEEEARLLVLAARAGRALHELVERRAAGEPLEHVVGWADFCGLRVALRPGVFVPRRRSELLVREAWRLASTVANPVVVDLCCGSGALGLAVVADLPGAELHASDLDPAAVACARENLGERGTVYEGDLTAALPAPLTGRVDVLVANVPYVPRDEIPFLPAEARLHEPRVALDGGADGLEVLARLAGLASRWLGAGGTLLSEVGDRQVARAERLLRDAGLEPRVVRDADLGATVVLGSVVEPAGGERLAERVGVP